jgi:hypothetical protein
MLSTTIGDHLHVANTVALRTLMIEAGQRVIYDLDQIEQLASREVQGAPRRESGSVPAA